MSTSLKWVVGAAWCVNLWKFLVDRQLWSAQGWHRQRLKDSRKSSAATFRLECVVAVGCCGPYWGLQGWWCSSLHGKHGELQHVRQSIATCVTFSACYCLFRSWMCAAQLLLLTSQQTQHSLELAHSRRSARDGLTQYGHSKKGLQYNIG